MLSSGDVQAACRVRRFEYAEKYGDEFTIRERRDSGTPTELEKIRDGFASHLLYCFAAEAQQELHSWFVGDLDVFRDVLQFHEGTERPLGATIPNGDGTWFRAFKIEDFPPDFVLGFHKPLATAA